MKGFQGPVGKLSGLRSNRTWGLVTLACRMTLVVGFDFLKPGACRYEVRLGQRDDRLCDETTDRFCAWGIPLLDEPCKFVERHVGLFEDRVHNVYHRVPSKVNVFGVLELRRLDIACIGGRVKQTRRQTENASGVVVELLGGVRIDSALESQVLCGETIDRLDGGDEGLLHALLQGLEVARRLHDACLVARGMKAP